MQCAAWHGLRMLDFVEDLRKITCYESLHVGRCSMLDAPTNRQSASIHQWINDSMDCAKAKNSSSYEPHFLTIFDEIFQH